VNDLIINSYAFHACIGKHQQFTTKWFIENRYENQQKNKTRSIY